MAYLVAYDIADDGRRDRVAKVLLDYGPRVQESVFWMDIDDELRDRMESRLKRVIDADADIIWVVPVCARCSALMTVMGATKKPSPVRYWVV